MNVAGHTMGTPEYDIDEAVALFASIGFDGIEVIWDDEYRCAIKKRARPSEIADLKRKVHALGMRIACLTPYMRSINSLEPLVREKELVDFARCIDVAQELECPCIRVYGGEYLGDRDSAAWPAHEDRLVDSLRTMGEKADRAGVTLAVETHFNTMTATAADTARIIRRVDLPSVRALYDPANLAFIAAEGAPESLRILRGLIAMVHVKDFQFRPDSDRRFLSSDVTRVKEAERTVVSRVPGEGILPWPEILASLKGQGFRGTLSLEYERRWHPADLPPAGEGMCRGLDYVRSILQSLEGGGP